VEKFLLDSSMDNADTATERMQRQKIHKLREYQFADEQWEAQRLKPHCPLAIFPDRPAPGG